MVAQRHVQKNRTSTFLEENCGRYKRLKTIGNYKTSHPKSGCRHLLIVGLSLGPFWYFEKEVSNREGLGTSQFIMR